MRNHASTNELVGQIKHAEFVYAEMPEQTLVLMRDGKADVMASTRFVLVEFFGKVLRRARARGPLPRGHQPNGRAERQDRLARLHLRL